MIIGIVVWVLAAVAVALFVARAWSRGALAATGRGPLARSGVDAVVALALVRALAPPPGLGVWFWVLAGVAVGVGAAGLILRRRSLPAERRTWTTVVYVVVGLAIVVVLA